MRAASRLTKISVSESSATMTTFLRFCVRRASVMSGTSERRQWLFSRRGAGNSVAAVSAYAISCW